MTGSLLLLAAAAVLGQGRPEIVLANFDADTYGAWVASGTAFGPGPARGTLAGQMAVSGYRGRGLVNSYLGGDGATGTLTSPEFVISRRYLNFLIGGGMHPGNACINLLIDGKIVRTATGPNDRPGGTERLDWAAWEVKDLEGKPARIRIVDSATGGWGHINVDEITMSDEKMAEEIKADTLYDETYRPQFHFTPRTNWTNDPNGLVYYRGEYHLFFQHNPFAIDWGNMTWGHAVSRDLVHWTQMANAIEPDKLGTIFSGSAVVDHTNSSGFGAKGAPAIVAIYTAAGGTSDDSKGQPFTQCLAYSTDKGRTWTKFAGNPVLPHIAASNRDPKVVWHSPTRQWIMALFLDGAEFALYASPNLKQWTELQRIAISECGECPDFFEIAVQGRPGETRWVLTAANGRYLVGTFDGRRFVSESGPHIADYGANYYAVQTYSDIPPSDGRRIQIAWMAGGQFPGMPFNQQMSFPCEMRLVPTPDGPRLTRWPVREIATLREKTWSVRDRVLKPGADLLKGREGELLDIEMSIDLNEAKLMVLTVRGERVEVDPVAKQVRCLGRVGPVQLIGGRLSLRVLVDRTSIEVFGDSGRLSMTSCFVPRPKDRALGLTCEGGAARVRSLKVHTLKSAWR